jgi:hypothetical protein
MSSARLRHAKRTPSAAPAAAITSDSVNSCCMMRVRRAPSAARIASSCCRCAPRASNRIDTLAHPISSNDATAPNNR